MWASSGQAFKAVVVSVQKWQPTLPYRTRRSDTPPPPTQFDFDVTFNTGCSNYIGHYESATDYLPDVIAPKGTVEMRVEKHLLYVKVRNDRELKMEIIRHQNRPAGSCDAAVEKKLSNENANV